MASVPRELRARRPAGRESQRLDEQVRDAWGEQAWTCQLCGEPIDPALPRGHPRSWSKDHELELARGGGNDISNLRPAHLDCNKRRRRAAQVAAQVLRTSREW